MKVEYLEFYSSTMGIDQISWLLMLGMSFRNSIFLPFEMDLKSQTQKLPIVSAPNGAKEIAEALKGLPSDQLAKLKEACVIKATPCPGPVDCSPLTVVAKDYKGTLAGKLFCLGKHVGGDFEPKM